MSSTQDTGNHGAMSQLRAAVINHLPDSVLLNVATGGVLLFVTGWLLDVGFNEGVWAAIFAAWGIGLMLAGVGSYGAIWWRR
ncbi:hypothetical protein [Halocatena pleomorpha]|uniref:Uncharacterized protein n=1 Tax=Halocatena pleomorpha TaxID=1785090 RepID=A0A3P3R9U0_9EURY|nr:hypothetical protein [Halocatena pleomorpha]RRJ30095.1 hypothetical protein EIK79_10965 [Halocatena pleomorpha]